MPRKLLTALVGLVAVASLAACQPAPPTPPDRPPADATVVDVQRENAVYVRWSVGSLYCRGTVTVLELGQPYAWEATGGPATGSVFLTPLRDGKFAGWVRATDATGRGRRCVTDVELIPAPTK